MRLRRLLCSLIFTLHGCLYAVPLTEGAVRTNTESPRNQYQNQKTVVRIVVDTTSHTLTVYRNHTVLRKYQIAVGKAETPTPIGHWKIVNKEIDWGGGFGTRWMGMNVPWGIYGIHGTNKPQFIGKSVSNGCIRMRNEDVEELFHYVPVGTHVQIVGDPLKRIRPLEIGNIGADVQFVQECLLLLGYYNGICDGRYGFLTEAAVKNFEARNGLAVDGVMGFDTYRKLGLWKPKGSA